MSGWGGWDPGEERGGGGEGGGGEGRVGPWAGEERGGEAGRGGPCQGGASGEGVRGGALVIWALGSLSTTFQRTVVEGRFLFV